MNKYRIYCTEEQSRKALSLGAPIDDIPMFKYGDNTLPKFTHRNVYSIEVFSYCPLVEEMIGWIEDTYHIYIDICYENDDTEGVCYYYTVNFDDKISKFYKTRKEASINAIDFVLDYISNKRITSATMESYIIYCTAHQTQKAYELGAPLVINSFPSNDGREYMFIAPPKDVIVWNNSTNCLLPTAEQMIGWLETRGIRIVINAVEETDKQNSLSVKWEYFVYDKNMDNITRDEFLLFDNRKEATLSAIEKALDFLKDGKVYE